jgi:hypothetical protein
MNPAERRKEIAAAPEEEIDLVAVVRRKVVELQQIAARLN